MPALLNKNTPRVECLGRFRLTVPESMLVAGRSQSIYGVDVRTLPMPPGGMKTFWEAHLARILPVPLPKESEQGIFRSFELQPAAPAVWYVRDPASPRIRNIEAAVASGAFVVLASTSGEAGKEHIVEDLIRIVFESYAASTSEGFCVGEGAVTSAPSRYEETLISLNHNNVPDFKIRFSTRAVSAPDTTTYSDVGEEKELIDSAGGKLNVHRDHSRSVAGLEGKEITISASAPGEPSSLRFTWHFQGVPGNSSKPMINIVGMTPAKYQPEFEKIWDALLNSIQTVSPSPQLPQ
jgi:hypothetical protein